MTRAALLGVLLALPAALPAQARLRPDPMPAPHPEAMAQGAQIMQGRVLASQFDTLGVMPMAGVGDSVTVYYFDDGATLTRARMATVRARQRFLPPLSWRAACDGLAHPGWLYTLDAPASGAFAVVVPGWHGLPERRLPPPLSRSGARPAFMAMIDSVWQRYRDAMQPKTVREETSLWYNFHTDSLDAGHGKRQLFGVRGPNGRNLAVFSFWLRNDHRDGTPNTTGTWLVDGWGQRIAHMEGNVDIYGVVDSDHDGIDEVVTSAGMIRWDGTTWRMPTVYSDEPCLFRRVMTPPPGVRP